VTNNKLCCTSGTVEVQHNFGHPRVPIVGGTHDSARTPEMATARPVTHSLFPRKGTRTARFFVVAGQLPVVNVPAVLIGTKVRRWS
jgi:hypothetical protein